MTLTNIKDFSTYSRFNKRKRLKCFDDKSKRKSKISRILKL